jgi:hypothetical protein
MVCEFLGMKPKIVQFRKNQPNPSIFAQVIGKTQISRVFGIVDSWFHFFQ